jgi:hypothetical protein
MNEKTFQQYKSELDAMSQSDYQRIKSSTRGGNNLGLGEVVCPLAQEVFEVKDRCLSCPLKDVSCPAFKELNTPKPASTVNNSMISEISTATFL